MEFKMVIESVYDADTGKSIPLCEYIDKRIAAALRLLQDGSGTGLAKQLRSVADFIDPAAKAEVRLNPCRECGKAPFRDTTHAWCANIMCDIYTSLKFDAWNAANPVQPVAEEKRYEPGQRFLHLGKRAYRTFMRHDGTVGIISSEGYARQ